MITYSSCKFRDAGNREMSIKLRDVIDSTKLKTLAKVIEGASTASFISSRFEAPESSPVAPGADSKVMYMAILVLKDGDGQIYRVTVPSVNPTLVYVDGKTEKLQAGQCTSISTAYGTATGKTGVTCISNSVIQKKYK